MTVVVCVCVCRSNDQACLQRLVFNMHDSDVAKFDEVIRHNSAMDAPVRRALYANIRRQIGGNFEHANKNHKSPICRYCRLKPLNEYVAFVVFAETPEFVVDTSTSQGETVPPAVVDKSTDDERNVDVGKTGHEGHQSIKKVSKMEADDSVDIKSRSREILDEIKGCKSEKKEAPRGSTAPERKLGNIKTARPGLTQTSDTCEQSAANKAAVSEDQNKQTVKVIGEITQQQTDVKKTSTLLVSEVRDVEPGGEPGITRPVQWNGTVEKQEPQEPHVVNKVDAPKLSADKMVTGKVSHLSSNNDASSKVVDSAGIDALYEWKADTVLQLKSDSTADDVGLKNSEYEKLSEWLSSRTDSTTTFHRFPTLYDLPVLAPHENPERSVTWRLAEKFEPSKPVAEEGPQIRNRCHDEGLPSASLAGKDRRAASDVIFVGPYDTSVIRHREVVRRRVSQICDDMLPQSSSDILCVTDVGSDIGLSRVCDIISTSKLSAAQFGAYTAADTESTCVSCVLLRFSPLTM